MPELIRPETANEVRGRAAYMAFHRQRHMLNPEIVHPWSELPAEHRLAWVMAARAAVELVAVDPEGNRVLGPGVRLKYPVPPLPERPPWWAWLSPARWRRSTR